MRHYRTVKTFAPSSDAATLHFVEVQYEGHKWFCETREPHTEAEIVEWIVDGSYGYEISRVLACKPEQGTCVDVTGRIAAFVFDYADAADEFILDTNARALCERFGHDVDALEAAFEGVVNVEIAFGRQERAADLQAAE